MKREQVKHCKMKETFTASPKILLRIENGIMKGLHVIGKELKMIWFRKYNLFRADQEQGYQ